MSMYGTRDAAQNWAAEYASTLIKAKMKQGIANPCLFEGSGDDVGALVHGDDFVVVGLPEVVQEVKAALGTKYKIKAETDEITYREQAKLRGETLKRLKG